MDQDDLPPDTAPMGRWERVWASGVALVVIVAVALPGARTLLEDEAADGFPLSTYPMFVTDRGRSVGLRTIISVGPDGDQPLAPDDPVERLSPRQIAGTDQVIQASATVRDAVDGGRGTALALCEEAARRVPAPATLVVLTEVFDSVEWAADDSVDPERRTEHARCEASG